MDVPVIQFTPKVMWLAPIIFYNQRIYSHCIINLLNYTVIAMNIQVKRHYSLIAFEGSRGGGW